MILKYLLALHSVSTCELSLLSHCFDVKGLRKKSAHFFSTIWCRRWLAVEWLNQSYYCFIMRNSFFFSLWGRFVFTFYCSHSCHKKVTFRNLIHGPWENMTLFIISDCNFQQKFYIFFIWSYMKPLQSLPNDEDIKTNTIYLLNVDFFLYIFFI